MIDILSLDENEIIKLAETLGERPYRGRQLFRQLGRGVSSFDEMTDLPPAFREKLAESCEIRTLTVQKRLESKDGTNKFLYGLHDGCRIETVFMKYRFGDSVCVSSQAGCRMKCAFCASGMDGLERDLSPSEMVLQVTETEKLCCGKDGRISRVVLMGTGEPFDNYENVVKAVRLLHHESGHGTGWRNITVSTCGIVPAIDRFAEDLPQVNLAVSLHAPNDRIRRELMPAAAGYPMEELIGACRRYTERTHRRVTFEYAVIEGVNDSRENMDELCRLLRGLNCHVNLIPLNRVRGSSLSGTSRERAVRLSGYLESWGIPATVRRTTGSDIEASCGQLRLRRGQ